MNTTLWPGRTISRFWCEAKDGDAQVRAIHRRHYSARHYRDGRKPKLFVGPGEKVVLVTPSGDAYFVWRKFISDDEQEGVNCAAFRNEGTTTASALILDAEDIAWAKWPGERFYTYVNPKKISSVNPGYCFKRAGWRRCGVSKGGLHVLEKRPEWRVR